MRRCRCRRQDTISPTATAARQAIAEPAMRKRFDSEGVIAVGNTPEQFGPFVQSEIKRWAQVVKYSGARPE